MSSVIKVNRGIWTDPDLRSLKARPSTRVLYIFALTGPHTVGITGLFQTSHEEIADFLGWPTSGVREASAEIEAAGLYEADWSHGVVWIERTVPLNFPGRPYTLSSWRAHWPAMPKCTIVDKARSFLRATAEERGPDFVTTFDIGVGDIELVSRYGWDYLRRTLAPIVKERDGFVCVYCGATTDLTIDHVKPIALGGTHDLTNLVTACRSCNSKKNAKAEWTP
jgi:hypothetical protein